VEGVPGLHPHAKFHCCGFKKVGLQPPKLPKFAFFWYKFAPKGKLWGSTEKLEYSCTTTNLPLCNDTIIVLKITLHHSVFVITNFFISKRDKKNRQKTSHFFVYSWRVRCDPHYTWHDGRGGPCHFCTP